MSRMLIGVAVVGFLGLAAAPVAAFECQTSVLIPERLAVVMCPNVDPATKFEKDPIAESAKKIKDEAKVEQVAIAFYAPTRSRGMALSRCWPMVG